MVDTDRQRRRDELPPAARAEERAVAGREPTVVVVELAPIVATWERPTGDPALALLDIHHRRRERIAIGLAPAIAASGRFASNGYATEWLVEQSILAADRMIAELDRMKGST